MEKKSYTVAPKCLIDLHLHLDGSISVPSARQLAAIEGVALPEEDEALRARLSVTEHCSNLNEYLERFELPCRLLQSEESISLAVYNLCRELAEEGHIYAEIRFAPQRSCDKGLSQDTVVRAALRGMERSGFPGRLILCCMRDGGDNRAENLETVRIAREYIGKGVCACDLAGAEALFPNERYAYVFEQAKALGVPFTIHAGEALGPESVRLAVAYGARRIGHGVRALEDETVVSLLRDRQVALELCPKSNLDTRIFPTIREFPIGQLRQSGIIVTVNTDNRSVSRTCVRKELQRISDAFGYGQNEIRELLLNAVEISFAEDAFKQKLRSCIEAEMQE